MQTGGLELLQGRVLEDGGPYLQQLGCMERWAGGGNGMDARRTCQVVMRPCN